MSFDLTTAPVQALIATAGFMYAELARPGGLAHIPAAWQEMEAETSTADLAAMAGLSARALQAGFQDVLGMSPIAYLRGARLDRVHLDLLSGVFGLVTDAAARWGFFHPGRFASQYRDRFGVLPSQTARRALS